MHIKEDPSILGQPEKAFKQGVMVSCPQCRAPMIATTREPTCIHCGHRLGDIIVAQQSVAKN